MKPWYFTLKSGRNLMVLPNAEVEHDGHPIISYHYNIFRSDPDINLPEPLSNPEPSFPDKTDPDFLGYISFEKPGQQYSYTSESEWALDRWEIAEIIDMINHVRENPELWQIDGEK
jgi:hypothetical protein